MMDFIVNKFRDFFFTIEFLVELNVESEKHSQIKNVADAIIKRLKSFEIDLVRYKTEPSPSVEEDRGVKVVFCPIVSRAGTDIEAALKDLRDDKPTIMFVLHHTFSADYNAPSSSKYKRNKLIMVDILFHEDLGLLKCLKNDEAISEAKNYLKQYGKSQPKVNTKRVFMICAAGTFVLWELKTKRIQRSLLDFSHKYLPCFIKTKSKLLKVSEV